MVSSCIAAAALAVKLAGISGVCRSGGAAAEAA
jgi:hypothetical protein